MKLNNVCLVISFAGIMLLSCMATQSGRNFLNYQPAPAGNHTLDEYVAESIPSYGYALLHKANCCHGMFQEDELL